MLPTKPDPVEVIQQAIQKAVDSLDFSDQDDLSYCETVIELVEEAADTYLSGKRMRLRELEEEADGEQ